ncbi:Cycloeucalenol cycloisomerase [Raphanus sativus]|nr:Cycloeucalenol cycloisomerase [Raphanus sativus]
MSGSSDVSRSLWLAQNPSKRWGELFFLFYTPFWLTLFLGIIVPYKLYETFTELEYLLVALVSAVPAFLIPMLVIGKADRGLCWKDRYWVKFPYYEFVDRNAMYRVGCLFYALYFIVSFPMFFRMDEKSSDKWELSRVAVDALGASMLVERWLFLPIWGLKDKPAREIPFALYKTGK